MSSIPPKLPFVWIPDNRINSCTICKNEFTYTNRKHHCRSCGKIFCSNCCYQYQSLPSYLPKTRLGNKKGKQLVCHICNAKIINIKTKKDLIFTFSCLPLTIYELSTLMYINKEWNVAAVSIIGVYKAIPYKCSYEKWSGLERRLLQNHWKEFACHGRWMVQAIRGLYGICKIEKVVRYYKEEYDHLYACSDLFCMGNCNGMSPFDILELITAFPSAKLLNIPEMEAWVGQMISNLDSKWMKILLPLIFQTDNTPAMQRIINNNVIPAVVKDLDMAYAFFFECHFLTSSCTSQNRVYYRALMDRFIGSLTETMETELDNSERLLFHLKQPDKLVKEVVYNCLAPWDTTKRIYYIYVEQIRRLNTNTAPWIVPIQYVNGETVELLIKHDDLRKDKFVVNVENILEELNSTFVFKHYNIMPITKDYGVIEMIDEATTLFEINKTTTLQNYIIQHNMNLTSNQIRRKFLFSCASNCILTYMLGVGDRNLGNIIITKDCHMTHIDFSYLLGHDPKSESLTEMRITPGMVDILGGKDSKEFGELKSLCSILFRSVKMNTYFWYSYFSYLCKSDPPIYPHNDDADALKAHLESRLMPESSMEEVEIEIVNIVDKNSSSKVAGWLDWAHSLKATAEEYIFDMD